MSEHLTLIDLSGIAHAMWHTSTNEPDPNATSLRTVAKVRALATGKPHVAICCDSGRSFRHDIDPSYKGTRPEHDAAKQHQIATAIETLRGDGFPIWAVKGLEADDIISAATVAALSNGQSVTVVSSDKDLLQLVGENDDGTRVDVLSPITGKTFDSEAVRAKFGIHPSQMRDYLCLVGDASDNIKGAKGIGEKRAAELLAKYRTLEGLHEAWANRRTEFTPGIATALAEFWPRVDTVRSLVTMKTDAPIAFEEILKPRVPADSVAGEDLEQARQELMDAMSDQPELPVIETTAAESDARVAAVFARPPAEKPAEAPRPVTALAVPEPDLPAPADWDRALEPRSLSQTLALAKAAFTSRLFSAYGTPEGIMMTVMAGREMGMTAMHSLRAFHIIEGKPTLAADAIRALVLRSGKAATFRCTERTAEAATFVTQRGTDPEIALRFTIQEARAAWPKGDAEWAKSGWGRNPADMLVARASAKLARLVYPDIIHGIHAAEELES